MPTVDLSTPPPPPPTLLAGLPRRLTLTLPELRLAAERAGGAPLPFDTADAPASRSGTGTGTGLESRLGPGRDDTGAAAYAATVEGLHDPEESLTRRGLLGQGGTGGLEPGLAGAVGLLGTPRVVVDLDVNVGGAHVHAWHREGRGAVATLATADGVVFELGWCGTRSWPGELARAAALPAGLPVSDSALPAVLDLPYELLDTAGEAFRGGRGDVVAVLAHRHGGEVLADGAPVPEAAVPGLLGALGTETRGRLRALVAELPDGSAAAPDVAGVTSWLLLADGWHALRPHTDAGVARVEVRRVVPDDLAGSLAPVLAEVTR